ncbi:MAG: hypothetical protein AVDCRST_MAG68-2687 [uncultured Gemmatimonadetes bacterium]|uniref:Lipoprotein n=1 Tax=uncultured Gemmatimonadota bacterium TaxID=203437 RepID=A0A6J4LJ69_9BACT|nr:MAG: hypothetical protein AVDCRST_MAG68-2687 [uncultured Gemmatimonadota bacterium]
MHPNLRAALAGALLLAAGCGGPARTAGPAPHPTARLAPATWTRASSPDSIAAWALRGCRDTGAGKQACYEHALVSSIAPAGVDRVMAALDRLSAADPAVNPQGHVYAHGIGIAAYTGAATVGETFARCTPGYQSGCYHGVIQAFFADAGAGGATAERLNTLCADYRKPEGRWLQFQCAHGAGHGLMAVHGQHLLRALEGCDLFANAAEREGCYGGAFMENIVNATVPHHTTTTQLGAKPSGGHDEHANHGGGGHAHGPPAQQEAFKALDKAQPLYPCTVVQARHRYSCYAMQTSPILFFNGGDFADAGKQCESAPEEMRRTCFVSLGRDAAAYAGKDDARAVALCQNVPEGRLPWCVIGTAKNRVDVTADPADGMAYCRAVPTADAKRTCYRAVGEELAALHGALPQRERACTTAEPAFIAECRAGAQVP